jgi:uncharacterized RDD family membrane protein YckC
MPPPDPISQRQFYDGIASKRLFAWFIDTALIIIICAIIVPFTAFTGLFFFPFLMFVVGFVYRASTLAGGSATWGMRAMAMELRTRDDRPLDGATAFLHTLGYTISFAFLPIQIISVILMATSASRQSVTDHVLGTVALNRRRNM